MADEDNQYEDVILITANRKSPHEIWNKIIFTVDSDLIYKRFQKKNTVCCKAVL